MCLMKWSIIALLLGSSTAYVRTFRATLTCTQNEDGTPTDKFEHSIGDVYEMGLVVDQASGYCNSNPVINLGLSIIGVSKIAKTFSLLFSGEKMTYADAAKYCLSHSDRIADSHALDYMTCELDFEEKLYVEDGMDPSHGSGDKCPVYVERDKKVIQQNCSEREYFYCISSVDYEYYQENSSL